MIRDIKLKDKYLDKYSWKYIYSKFDNIPTNEIDLFSQAVIGYTYYKYVNKYFRSIKSIMYSLKISKMYPIEHEFFIQNKNFPEFHNMRYYMYKTLKRDINKYKDWSLNFLIHEISTMGYPSSIR